MYQLIVREFRPFNVELEFRGFVVKKNLTALTQYNEYCYFPNLVYKKNCAPAISARLACCVSCVVCVSWRVACVVSCVCWMCVRRVSSFILRTDIQELIRDFWKDNLADAIPLDSYVVDFICSSESKQTGPPLCVLAHTQTDRRT